MSKKKGCLPGCLGAFWAALTLACGGFLSSNGPTARPNYLQPTDLILLTARSDETTGVAVYAVTRGDRQPKPWESSATEDLTAVTAASHGYIGHWLFPHYEQRAPAYYGANGRHYLIPRGEAPPPRPQPPDPEDSRMENRFFVWSPDGRYLAYSVYGKQRQVVPGQLRQLRLFDSETGESQLVRENGFEAQPLLWSDDGRYLFANINVRLERWDRETDDWTDLDWTSDYVESSPDGQHLLWYYSAEKTFSLSDPLGENRYPLIEEGSNNQRHIAWSPDGRYLAYQRTHGGYAYIHIADLAQRTVKQIYEQLNSSAGASGYTMAWSPDSSQIAFLGLGQCTTTFDDLLTRGSTTYCNRDLYVIPLDGGAAQRITNTNNGAILIDDQYAIVWLTKE